MLDYGCLSVFGVFFVWVFGFLCQFYKPMKKCFYTGFFKKGLFCSVCLFEWDDVYPVFEHFVCFHECVLNNLWFWKCFLVGREKCTICLNTFLFLFRTCFYFHKCSEQFLKKEKVFVQDVSSCSNDNLFKTTILQILSIICRTSRNWYPIAANNWEYEQINSLSRSYHNQKDV